MTATEGVPTNWVVITGAPSSGKTSVILELARRGYAVEGEVARMVIEERMRNGETLQSIRGDNIGLQRQILKVKLGRHRAMDPQRLTFLDRGLDDSLTYFRLGGGDPAEPMASARLFRYRAIFLFDRLPVIKDNIRTEDEALAKTIDEMMEKDYQAMGYATVRVPVMPIVERAEMILQVLNLPARAEAA